MANLLTSLRLLLVLPVAAAFAQDELLPPPLLLALVIAAIATDYFDGIVARRMNTASPGNQLYDHATDFAFVAAGLAGAAMAGDIIAALPLLVVLAFSQYVLDSYYLYRDRHLRLSALGRWNGILYFVPLVLIAVSRLELVEGLDAVFAGVIVVTGYVLVLSTLASIIDRAVAPLGTQQRPEVSVER